jgi:hypothetical protein
MSAPDNPGAIVSAIRLIGALAFGALVILAAIR